MKHGQVSRYLQYLLMNILVVRIQNMCLRCTQEGHPKQIDSICKIGQIKGNQMYENQRRNRTWLALGTAGGSMHGSIELEYGMAGGEVGMASIDCTI